MKIFNHLGKVCLIGATLTLLITSAWAQDLRLNWAVNIGGSDNDYAIYMDRDSDENLYVAGVFKNTVDFDPSAATSSATSNGDQDVYLAKYNKNGDLLWNISFGGTGKEVLDYLHRDQKGNILLTGRFSATVDFDPSSGTSTATSNGTTDMYLVKFTKDGDFVWKTTMGGTGVDDGFSIASTQSNEYFVCGYFDSTITFDNGSTQFTSLGYSDMYLAKYSENGALQFAHQFGNTGSDLGIALAMDQNDNLYFTGHYQHAVSFDPNNASNTLTPVGIYDIFLVKYDSNFNYQWARSIGGDHFDNSYGINTDNAGNVYLTGGVKSTNPSFGSINLTGNGNYDVFLAKYDGSGNALWAKNFGGADNDGGYNVVPDNNGNLFMCGVFRDSIDFGDGMHYANSDTSGGFFLTKFQDDGTLIWAETFINDKNNEYGRAISLGDHGEIYMCGYVNDTTDIDPQASENLVGTHGMCDGYLAKFVECTLQHGSLEYIVCAGDSMWLFDEYVSQSGVYVDTVYNSNSCDSVYTTTITVLDPNESVSNISGTIMLNDTAITSGMVLLYAFNIQNPNDMTLIDSMSVDVNGHYSFDSVPEGSYRIKAYADTSLYENTVPTYNDSTNHWQKATVLNVTSCKDSLHMIDVNLIDFSTQIGYGKINGKVVKGTKNGVKLEGLDIYALDNLTDQVYAHTTTKSNGEFVLNNLEEGTYLVTAEIPGYNRANDELVTISSELYEYEYELCLDSVASTVTACYISGLDKKVSLQGLDVYPNPASKELYVSYECSDCHNLKLILTDLTGRMVLEQALTANQTNAIQIRELESGTYMYQIIGIDESVSGHPEKLIIR